MMIELIHPMTVVEHSVRSAGWLVFSSGPIDRRRSKNWGSNLVQVPGSLLCTVASTVHRSQRLAAVATRHGGRAH
jgi:hypothetical protein